MPEPAPSPRPTMNDLPTEIKARIVELCAEQDERYKEEVAKAGVSLRRHGSAVQGVYGRSVRMLFQVSKEFSRLAEPFLFKVLKASKVDIHFKCAIAPSLRRLSYFKEVHLDSGNVGSLTDVIGVLPRLSSLEKLALTSPSTTAMWSGETVSLDSDQVDYASTIAQYAAPALRHLARLTELHISSGSWRSAVPFVKTYDTLRVLRLDLIIQSYYSYGSPSSLDGLSEALSGTKDLKELHIVMQGDYAPDYPVPNFSLVRPTTVPPLRHLSLKANNLATSYVAFSSLFSATLERLSLLAAHSYEPGHTFPQPKFTSQVFPKVTHLTLAGPESLTFETLDSVNPRVFPALITVELDFTSVTTWEGTDSPLFPFSNFPLLRTICIPKVGSFPDEAAIAIETFCSENGLNLAGDESIASTLSPCVGGTASSRLALSIRTTLAYLEKQVEQAENEGDEDGLKRIKASLQAIEAERVTEMIWQAV